MASNKPGASNIGNPAGFVSQYVQQGLSARAALREFRDAGGTMGNERFRSLYASVADSLARGGSYASLDPYSVPSPADLGTWKMGRGGQYATQVTLHGVDKQTGMAI